MKVTGFTFIRNGIIFDYPFIESISSLLPICDEVIIAVGQSDDNTLAGILSLNSPKIKIIQTVWDDSFRTSGTILSQQTNIALDQVKGDWAIYLQADEVLHEKDYSVIMETLALYKNTDKVEGLLFHYNHFYGSYNYIGDSRRWYRREIRIVRPNIGVRSWGDAQGFRRNEKKLHVKLIDAAIYHYGWVKPPETQQLKQKAFNKFWHSDKWVNQHIGTATEYNYKNGGRLKTFDGTHPAVMKKRVCKQNWQFLYDQNKLRQSIKEILLDAVEAKTGWRIGEYKNYTLL